MLILNIKYYIAKIPQAAKELKVKNIYFFIAINNKL